MLINGFFVIFTMQIVTCKERKKYPVEAIGGKAQGLLKLKSMERRLSGMFKGHMMAGARVPDFFVVPAGEPADLESILKQADALRADTFAVRSSSPYEDGIQHSFDGVFESCLNIERNSLLEAIEHVKASALGERARQYSRDFNVYIDGKMAVIVQQMAEGQVKGLIYSKFPASIEVTKIIS